MHVNCHVSPSLSLFYLCFPLSVSIFSSFFSFRFARTDRRGIGKKSSIPGLMETGLERIKISLWLI